jgi:hypothetical protein
LNENQKQYSNSLEINDLIDAVRNAVVRRSDLTETEDDFYLSDEKSASVNGGMSIPWHTIGYFAIYQKLEKLLSTLHTKNRRTQTSC